MESLNRVPLYQQAYLRLRHLIAIGELEPGSRVDVQTMADQLGISRTPVREAIRQLIQEGLLRSNRDGRVYVIVTSVEDLAEVYLARAAIESTSVRAVVQSGVEFDLSRLSESLEDSAVALACSDLPATIEANSDFHERLGALTQSRLMTEWAATTRIRMTIYRGDLRNYPERHLEAHGTHEEIVRRLESRDPSVADLVFNHVLWSGRWAISRLEPDGAHDSAAMAFLRNSNSSQ